MKVLIAEDDHVTRAGLAELLQDEGYEVFLAEDGEQAIIQFNTHQPQFVCLDVMMPKLSGYEACRHIRESDDRVPIIFISAKSQELDKVAGFELGADDFIVKPFGVKEVIARIRAVTRRCLQHSDPTEDQSFQMDDLEVRPDELRAIRDNESIDLSLRDVQILKLLFEKCGQPVSRQIMFEECWGLKNVRNSRTLDQHISQLRKRIEHDPKSPRIITTVHGAGYRYQR